MSSIYYISEKADALIKKYDTRDPLALCRELRIRVRYKDLGTAVKAYYFYQSRIKNIVLNSRSGSIVQRARARTCRAARKACRNAGLPRIGAFRQDRPRRVRSQFIRRGAACFRRGAFETAERQRQDVFRDFPRAVHPRRAAGL